MKKILCCLLAVASAMFGGCSPGPSYVAKYGVAYNAEREKRGIPIVDSNWTIQDFSDYFDSFDPNLDQSQPRRQMKRVSIDQKGIILGESDTFYSGKTFLMKGTGKEVFQGIEMTYRYEPQKEGNPWIIHADLGPDQFNVLLTLGEADRVLASWGLSRTNKLVNMHGS